jgi:hypothetical protein
VGKTEMEEEEEKDVDTPAEGRIGPKYPFLLID